MLLFVLSLFGKHFGVADGAAALAFGGFVGVLTMIALAGIVGATLSRAFLDKA